MKDPQAVLIADTLAPHEVKALRILSRTAGDFDRVGSMPGLAQPMIDHLLTLGLAEQGVANHSTGKPGYRLSELGSKVFTALAHRRPKRQALKMIEPRIKTMDTRTVKPMK